MDDAFDLTFRIQYDSTIMGVHVSTVQYFSEVELEFGRPEILHWAERSLRKQHERLESETFVRELSMLKILGT